MRVGKSADYCLSESFEWVNKSLGRHSEKRAGVLFQPFAIRLVHLYVHQLIVPLCHHLPIFFTNRNSKTVRFDTKRGTGLLGAQARSGGRLTLRQDGWHELRPHGDGW